MRRIRLTETSAPCVADISASQADALAATRLVSVVPAGDGRAVLSPGRNVGAVRMDNIQVEVWPKDSVKLTQLLFLLGYAADPGFRAETVMAEDHDELWPVLAESLARLAERALLGGILQGYRTVNEAATVVRGRIRIADQMRRHPGVAFPLEVSYDDYLADIPENRVLRTALRRMRAVPRLDPTVTARIAHLENRLDGVSVLRPSDPIPPWQPTRLNARYIPALRLAELVLRHSSAHADAGNLEIAAFVVSMWKAYEDFVTVALREALAVTGIRAESQARRMLDEPRSDGTPRVPMAMDLLAYDGAEPVMIYDAKYKAAASDGQYPNADLYQMLAYCTTTQLPEAALIYAAGGQPIRRRVVASDVTLIQWPLDLSTSPTELLAQIAAIAAATAPRRALHAAS